jgi:hypothetical protein
MKLPGGERNMTDKLKMPYVTLFALTSIYIPETIQSLLYSSKDIDFKSIKILTHEKPQNLPEQIEYVEIPKINNIEDYNQFCFTELGQYINSEFSILTQYHAFILDSSLFRTEWYQYDYNAAPWPIREGSFIANNGERVRVGNGGFSWRSKYLMSIPKMNHWQLREQQGFKNEDGQLCVYWRAEMLAMGIKYAPVEEAAHFAYENPVPENYEIPTFGFHRYISPWQNL